MNHCAWPGHPIQNLAGKSFVQHHATWARLYSPHWVSVPSSGIPTSWSCYLLHIQRRLLNFHSLEAINSCIFWLIFLPFPQTCLGESSLALIQDGRGLNGTQASFGPLLTSSSHDLNHHRYTVMIGVVDVVASKGQRVLYFNYYRGNSSKVTQHRQDSRIGFTAAVKARSSARIVGCRISSETGSHVIPHPHAFYLVWFCMKSPICMHSYLCCYFRNTRYGI